MTNYLSENLLKNFGLDSLPDKKREEILLKTGQVIFEAILIRILKNLDDQSQKELDALLSSDSGEEEILNFLKSKISNFDELVAEEINRFHQESARLSDALK